MEERHELEQYFFDDATVVALIDALGAFERICCLCTPMLAVELYRRGRKVTLLDVDDRFTALPYCQRWDVYRPRYLAQDFDLIICDPPFFTVKLGQLFTAIRTLAHFDYSKPLLVSFLIRRAVALTGTFYRFNLQPTGFLPGYVTLQHPDIEFFSNFGFGASKEAANDLPVSQLR